jgi:hypothetical protein
MFHLDTNPKRCGYVLHICNPIEVNEELHVIKEFADAILKVQIIVVFVEW